ncbi:N-acetylmuramoyl-L-alanine amidase [Rossellomorea sp. SC111]|uniref:N-acetylmuramoyl-L-alanine amidase family protein n=1 Tax=Rossellomorea sp. SC111 TaxID=2968985 RepID=UPI00215AC3BF|nr:N-acetylmuramoyl-L-alanine amidase [Rossellomorea sp. SC111]MCR8847880.1 N-acetylmuramoyl-L-alanine amidase [Rossellomorea sp. SC111]
MAKASDYLIALDDGHGLGTAGKRTPYIPSIGRQIRENEFNEKVTLYLKLELERCGFRTLLTAPTDADTPLQVRTDIANSMGADALVSNHYNAFDGKFDGPGKDAEGHSLHIYFNDAKDRKLAENIAKYLKQGTKQVYRGIIEQNLHMTREFNGPAVLVENGFMDNEREGLLMINEDFQRETAREQALGVCDFFGVSYVAAGNGGNVGSPPVSGGTSSGDVVGKRVESIYKGAEGLDFYSRPTFDDTYRAGILKYGYGFPTIVRKLKVEGADMYEVINSRGYVFYVTASPKYVKVEGSGQQGGPVSPPPATGGPIAIGEITIIGVANAAIIQDRPDRLASKDLSTIRKGRTIPVTGSVRGKNSSSGYWEVVYNGRRAYITGEFGRYKAY